MSASSSVLWSDQSRSRKAPVNMAELFESGGLSAARTHSYLRQKQDITGTIWKGEEKIRPNEFSRRWNWMYLPDSVQKYIPKFIWSQHESEWNKPSVPELLSFTTQFLLTVNLPPQQLSEKKNCPGKRMAVILEDSHWFV